MPYKDPEARRACHRKSDKGYRATHKDQLRLSHREERKRWRDRIAPAREKRISRMIGYVPFTNPEEELQYLIAEQAKDDRSYLIKRDLSYYSLRSTKNIERGGMVVYDEYHMPLT